MAHVTIDEWWKAQEIPLVEINWRNIKRYCGERSDAFDWERCVYFFRLSPPLLIAYGEDGDLESPLLYVGSGTLSQRWSTHRAWLRQLGQLIPGGRYEVSVCRPRLQRTESFYKDIEADIINEFHSKTGYYPLRNRRREKAPRKHTYEPDFFGRIFQGDRRYFWAIYPTENNILKDSYYRGVR